MVMAMTQWCQHCERETRHHDCQCTVCAERKRKEYLMAWNAMSVDERLSDLRRRIEQVERGPFSA